MKKKIINEKNILILVYLSYILFNIICALVHEHWRDEGQAWMLAKNLSIPELIQVLPGEGHPALWYLILMPFAKLGFPYKYFSFISCGIMIIASGIFLKSKVPVIAKILLLFSPIFSYYNTALARSYALVILEIVLIGYYYEKRSEKKILWALIIALMFQTHMYIAGLAVMLSVQMIYETIATAKRDKKSIIGIGIVIASIVLLVMEISGERSAGLDTQLLGVLQNPMEFILGLKDAFIRLLQVAFVRAGYNSYTNGMTIGLIVLIILMTLVAIIQMKKCWQELLIFLGGIGGICLINSYVYQGLHVQHGIVCVAIIFLYFWLIFQKIEKSDEGRRVLFLVCKYATVLFSFFMIMEIILVSYRDLILDYSGAKRMAVYLNENFSEGEVFILGDNSDSYSNLSAYTEGKFTFLNAANGTEYLYYKRLSDTEEMSQLDNLKNEDVYYIYTMKRNDDGEFELVHEQSSFNYMGENFYLYKKY